MRELHALRDDGVLRMREIDPCRHPQHHQHETIQRRPHDRCLPIYARSVALVDHRTLASSLRARHDRSERVPEPLGAVRGSQASLGDREAPAHEPTPRLAGSLHDPVARSGLKTDAASDQRGRTDRKSHSCARPTASSCSAATLPLGLGSARSTQTLVHALHEFHRVGVDVISSQEHIDTTASPGEMLCTVMASLAQFERALISERVKAGMARARAQDQRISRTPDAPRGPRAYCGPLSAGGLDPSDKPAAEHCVEHSVE